MTFDQLLFLFKSKHCAIEETAFYFADDPEKSEHYLGYLPQYEKPYWAVYCDIDDGCEFLTAEELFYAKIYDGKSLKDRWEDVVLFQIGGMDTEYWMKMFGDCLKNE